MKLKTMAGLLLVAAGMAATPVVNAATDYFAVADQSNRKVYVFTVDSDTDAIAYVAGVNMTNTPNTYPSVKPLPGHGFVVGQTGSGAIREGFEIFATADKLVWTSLLRVDMKDKTAAGEFFDTGFRASGTSTDPGTLSAALLKDGRIFITDARGQPSSKRYYGLGSVNGLSGDVSAIFPRDSSHLGTLADSTGSDTTLIHVSSTFEGSADRFAAVSWNSTTTGKVMIYNGDGTFKGYLTRLGASSRHGVGNFKQTDWGDLIIQVDGLRADPATIHVNARWVNDAQWDTQQFSFTLPSVKGTGTGVYFIEPRNVDALESGRIVVLGETRGGGGDYTGVWVFESNDHGATWSSTTSNPVNLRTISGAPSTINGFDIAGLYALPEAVAGTVILFQ